MLTSTINAIKDTAARAFLQPFFAANSAVAQRTFLDALQDPSAGFIQHASDYELYEIAAFDSITGICTPLEEPRLIVRGKDLVTPSTSENLSTMRSTKTTPKS